MVIPKRNNVERYRCARFARCNRASLRSALLPTPALHASRPTVCSLDCWLTPQSSTVGRFAATFAALRPARLRRDRRTAPSPDRLDAHLSGRCATRCANSLAGFVRSWSVSVVMTAASIGAAKGGGYARYLESKTVEPERGDYYLSPDGEPTQAPGRWLASPDTLARLGIEGELDRRPGLHRADGRSSPSKR